MAEDGSVARKIERASFITFISSGGEIEADGPPAIGGPVGAGWLVAYKEVAEIVEISAAEIIISNGALILPTMRSTID